MCVVQAVFSFLKSPESADSVSQTKNSYSKESHVTKKLCVALGHIFKKINNEQLLLAAHIAINCALILPDRAPV